MKCPVDDTELQVSERQGVEIDYCPRCRGVWLDRNELDKIIERSAQFQPAPVPPPMREGEPYYRDEQYRDDYYRDERYRPYGEYGYPPQRRRKREGFLSDLFDFGD